MKHVLNKSNINIFCVNITAFVGMIIYIMTSLTGYLATSVMNPIPVICTICIFFLTAVIILREDKIGMITYDIFIILVNILLLISFYCFILSRVTLAADVYFIPVNYPASEADALHISIAGVIFYLIADIMMIAMAFGKNKK